MVQHHVSDRNCYPHKNVNTPDKNVNTPDKNVNTPDKKSKHRAHAMRASINTQLAHDQGEYDREGADEEMRSATNSNTIIRSRAVRLVRRPRRIVH